MAFFDFLKKKELSTISNLVAENEKLKLQLSKYSSILNVEDYVESKKTEVNQLVQEENKNIEHRRAEFLQETLNERNRIELLQGDFNRLKVNYKGALSTYNNLKEQISLFENKIDLLDYGVYTPIYDFEKSDEYRDEQNRIVNKQKEMIQDDTAALCYTNWTVEGSEAKGKRVVKVYKKLMLRAFNAECDVMIAKVKWNNISQLKERMSKVFDAINKLGDGFKVTINQTYLELKIKELTLEYEFQAKKQQEKEEMRAIQEELREEEKARRDFEKAQREAEKQEGLFQKALEKARKEFEQANGVNAEALQIQIQRLEQELMEAHEKKERALSMAQQTKRGHVYIISNIGAFGENVYKIGMTRRLEPLDRVKELGDASVPFQFDIHAMIYSDEARTLEFELHKAFSDRKVNMLNYRKEFFRVSLEEIEAKIKELGFEAEFTTVAEAMEYRETLALIENGLNECSSMATIDYPEFPNSFDDELVVELK